jgi:hypothetical protein
LGASLGIRELHTGDSMVKLYILHSSTTILPQPRLVI